jgi:ABC-type sugar transport system ATPase subunit
MNSVRAMSTNMKESGSLESPRPTQPTPRVSATSQPEAERQAQPGNGEAEAADVLLRVEQLTKWFGAIRALTDVTLWARRAEITAIVGDNGAGKSTLVKCISGFHTPTAGRILFEGREVHFTSPEDARRAGIETVYQHLALVDDLTVWQNVFLNRELVRQIGPLRVLDRPAMRREARRLLERLEVGLPSVHARLRRLSGGQRQAVAIARAAAWGSRLLIMDEPTAALGVRETARVEELILRLRAAGLAILLISHNLEQVMRLSQQVWVMRGGRLVGGRRIAETSQTELVAMITGVLTEHEAEEEEQQR